MSFYKGMDVSLTKTLESLGAEYFLDGRKTDLFELLKSCGTDLIRLRLWVNPYTDDGVSYGGGANDIATTIELAHRAINAGMNFMLDFQYSDFWTDPAKQIKPKAWKEYTGQELREQVYQYTKRVLYTLKDENLSPSHVQVGNEITNGLLWPDGKSENVEDMALLLKAGAQGAREVMPDARIILHLDFGTDNELYSRWFSDIEPYGVDYDIIGMSYYPHWNGKIEDLKHNMDAVALRFHKNVMVTETSIGYTTDSLGCNGMVFTENEEKMTGYPATKEGQKDFLADLIRAVRDIPEGRGEGVVYWEPAWLPIPECTWATEPGRKYMHDKVEAGNSNGNQALFDAKGNANPALLALSSM